MNRRMVLYLIGQMMKIEALLMLLPFITSLIYREDCASDFALTIVITLVCAFAITIFSKPSSKVIYAKDGFVIVAMTWIILSCFGALPFVISCEIPSFTDAFFETVSGFTTTGASILSDVESMSRGLLFWRSFTHWIGGMGVLVFIMAINPNVSDRSIHIMRAEMPGPIVGKLVPRTKDTAKILYLIYIAMTVAEIIFLLLGKMPLFEAITHTFGTAGTGGFGVKSDSIAGYSPYIQWVITIFMLLFGINFNIYFLLLVKKTVSALKSTELWTYLGIVAVCITAISINIYHMYDNIGQAIRHAAFQVSSIVTTTGFATTDFNLWPTFSKGVLLILMLVGACAGSTGGGFKVSRIIILVKAIKREFTHLLHPRTVKVIRYEGKKLDEQTIHSVLTYLAIYSLCLLGVSIVLFIEPFDVETSLTAAVSCFNNIGPGLAGVGPVENYAAYSDFSKIVLSFAMLLGRLEIFPLLLAFSPSTWIKK